MFWSLYKPKKPSICLSSNSAVMLTVMTKCIQKSKSQARRWFSDITIKSWHVSGAQWSSHAAVCRMQIRLSRSHFMLHVFALRAYQVFSAYHDSMLVISSADIQQINTSQHRNQKFSFSSVPPPLFFSPPFLPFPNISAASNPIKGVGERC